MIQLRDYQSAAVARIREAYAERSRRILLVLPTGGGKTIVFCWIGAAVAARGKRVVVLVHRAELLEQVSKALAGMGVEHGLIAAGHPTTEAAVQVASVATLARRLAAGFAPPDLIVIDEAHHAVAGTWNRVIDAAPESFVLGVSATPARLDGRGLGSAFDVMVEGPTVAELTAAGHLVPARVFAPPERLDLSKIKVRAGEYDARQLAEAMAGGTLIGDAVAHYRRLAAGRPAVAFCASIEHSQIVAARFRGAGVAAAHVDGKTDAAERRRLIAGLGTGELRVLTNVDLIGEGVDVPAIGAVILLRPTRSEARYLQSVGRALRPSAGKSEAIVLDHAGATWMHGLPDAPRAWSLADQPARRSTGRTEAPGERLRQCEACGAFEPPGTPACGTCGASLKPCPAEIQEAEAELVERQRQQVEQVRRMDYIEVERWANTPDRLRIAARIRGYHPGWVKHRLNELEAD
ncbi:DEAD/DEAH box helicase [Methylobacterium radiotolerans]|uniref:Type III restriction protein res subunit n=1 Tax=Methylobacterium radiotolerans (strain ATCC 27329 / DSM 1819 / JCM 2831 / NBRC 15690 / NCIMB 10815 / 0-1) TaxID=426355 RepID=B1MAA8_METRJ|nr:DEAD/DEAH box helicase [Methylobacterium radiotolerans]ACB28433.1 type III restriction protein res subunit [Methylobacterium radiotolerans JCM 2831]GEN01735.1 DEAD/DEAH box helicase [Methylobacterium radiotolerans]